MRPWFVSSLLVYVACSDGSVHSGTVPEQADFLPMAADTDHLPSALAVDADTLGASDGEQPRLVLRCEAGRLGAYLIVGTSADVESGQMDRAVEVRLDSAPSC